MELVMLCKQHNSERDPAQHHPVARADDTYHVRHCRGTLFPKARGHCGRARAAL